MMIALAMALALQASAGGSYLQEANALGADVFMSGACEGMELASVDRDELIGLGTNLRRRALAQGISVDQFNGALFAGSEERKKVFEATHNEIMRSGGPDLLSRGMALLRPECAPLFTKYPGIVRPGVRWDQESFIQ